MLVCLGIVFWMIWFLIASGQPWLRRIVVWVVPIVSLAAFFSVFEIQRVSGEMIPSFGLKKQADRPTPNALGLALQAVPPVIDLKTETPNDFPEFLGPGRRQALDHVRINPDWQAHPPQELWKQAIGAGWSGFAVRNGYAITMEQRGKMELVTCYEVDTGKPCWTWAARGDFRSTIAGDGPRSTPAIVDGKVYTMGVNGRVAALDGDTGRVLWHRELDEELGITDKRAQVLPYGRSGSPLVVDELVIVPFGGSPETGFVSLLAMDRTTGETVWKGGDHQIGCASPAVATLGDRRQILSVDSGRVAGYDLADGKVLWSRPWPGRVEADCNVSQPVPLPGDRVFVSKGYGQGAALLQLKTDGDAFQVDELWHSPRVLRTKFTNVVIHNGYVYGLSDGILECAELETGKRMWKKGRYRHGQILRVSDHLIVLAEDGEVLLIEATPDRPNNVLARIQAIEGKTWNTFALYGDRLLVRNGREAAAYQLPVLD